jgi:putative aldouronate transport system permease protein
MFYVVINTLLFLIFIVIVIPMWSTITLSFRPNHFIGSNLEGMFLAPWKWSTAAYKALLGNRGFVQAFMNSLKIFVMGVTTALIFTVPLAYSFSIRTLPGLRFLNIFVLIPYLFNVGLIPTYLVVTGIGLTDHLAAVFLPGAISTYNLLIMKRFFEGIPEELKESARIDGASELYVLLRIVLPLSKPILLTIGLYYGVSFWNDFLHAMIYLNKSELQPLPILLRNILLASGMNEFVEVSAFGEASVQSIKAASVFLAAIPMIIAYPFIQKYFTKGTLLGSVKG